MASRPVVRDPKEVFWETRSSDCQAYDYGPWVQEWHSIDSALFLGSEQPRSPLRFRGRWEKTPARHVAPPGCLAFFLPPVSGNADAQAHTPGDSDLTGPGCGLGICTERPQSF